MLPENTITQLLKDWGSGHDSALEELIPKVYETLHKIAEGRLRGEKPGNTLQPTALINEAYIKLDKCREYDWVNRAKFFAICAQLMRQVLIDYARHRKAIMHGGDLQRVTFDEALNIPWIDTVERMMLIDEALIQLAGVDKRQSQVVELRVFAEMTIEETAQVLKVSPDTVKRDWQKARKWLFDYYQDKNVNCRILL